MTGPKPALATHILVIVGDDLVDREYTVECSGLTPDCLSWSECSDPACPTRDDDDHDDHDVLHGVEHRLFSFGWCVPNGQCFVVSNEHLADAASDVDRGGRMAPGRYPVEFDVEDETDLTLWLAEDGAR